MINFNIRPRQTGKTTEIINKLDDKSVMITVYLREIKKLKYISNCHHIYQYKSIPLKLSSFENIYFDEYFYMDYDFDNIIHLDKIGKNVHIYGTLPREIDPKVKSYLKEYYPEYLI